MRTWKWGRMEKVVRRRWCVGGNEGRVLWRGQVREVYGGLGWMGAGLGLREGPVRKVFMLKMVGFEGKSTNCHGFCRLICFGARS